MTPTYDDKKTAGELLFSLHFSSQKIPLGTFLAEHGKFQKPEWANGGFKNKFLVYDREGYPFSFIKSRYSVL